MRQLRFFAEFLWAVCHLVGGTASGMCAMGLVAPMPGRFTWMMWLVTIMLAAGCAHHLMRLPPPEEP